MPIIMSIRKVHSDNIFQGFKRIEFRKFFPLDYKGTVVVYECGPNSLHKVVGTFKTANPVRYEPSKGITEQVINAFKTTDYTTFDVECLKQFKEPVVCIPVISPKIINPISLSEFSAKYGIKPSIKPPMSWQRFKCEKEKRK